MPAFMEMVWFDDNGDLNIWQVVDDTYDPPVVHSLWGTEEMAEEEKAKLNDDPDAHWVVQPTDVHMFRF